MVISIAQAQALQASAHQLQTRQLGSGGTGSGGTGGTGSGDAANAAEAWLALQHKAHGIEARCGQFKAGIGSFGRLHLVTSSSTPQLKSSVDQRTVVSCMAVCVAVEPCSKLL